jgi:RimJ/RimL family protein N-acetyltransferase
VKRGQREQVLPSPSATRLGPIHAWAKCSSNETTTVAVQSAIWLLEDGRGKGRATRAVRLMASWALPEMRLRRLQLHTDPENVASQRVAERAGFTREGVLRAYNVRRDGTRADAVVYSLLPHDLAPTYFANPS